jgi:alpha-tubulin suppressor-like RCC1 family protein
MFRARSVRKLLLRIAWSHRALLFVEGRGDDGRLGHGDNGWKYVPRIIQSLTGQVVVQVTCGSYHTAAVTSDGSLWTWGGGMYGKLGHGNEAGCSTPKRVEGLVGLSVAQIACGSRHTVVITTAGAAYSWGDCENGVAGHGLAEGHQYTPKLLERLAGRNIVQLSVRLALLLCRSDFSWSCIVFPHTFFCRAVRHVGFTRLAYRTMASCTHGTCIHALKTLR